MLKYRKIKMNNLAIVGASYLQMPLIEKAKEMGYKTHVFAWAANDIGEEAADVFYPISIIEKDQILEVKATQHINYVHVISGEVMIADHLVKAGDALVFDETATITALQDSQMIWFDLP